MELTILGGGLSAISLAYFLQNNEKIEKINIIEKNDKIGGICCSYCFNGITYDIGPHVIFSKNTKILKLMNELLGKNINKLHHFYRSNRILYKNRFIQYPFENDLSKLSQEEIDYCLKTFLDNRHKDLSPKNMLQFFLKTFGEGITNLYLKPYNEKIWKYNLKLIDTQIVKRIPSPSKEDIIKSAKGEAIEGHLHQFNFTYPKKGGIEALVKAFKLQSKVKVHTNSEVLGVRKENNKFLINTSKEKFISDKIVSTIPVNKLAHFYEATTPEILTAADDLKYNSIAIGIINVKLDKAKDNFAFMIPDKEIIFHRLSKLDFLGENYSCKGSTSYMVEITYRKNDTIDNASDEELKNRIIEGLKQINFINTSEEVNFIDLKRIEYAYIIYDLNHKKNMDIMKKFFNKEGVYLNGRFGTFEYLNMDAVIQQSLDLSLKL